MCANGATNGATNGASNDDTNGATNKRCYHEESLQEKSKLAAGVLLPLTEVVAVVHQVGVQPDLWMKEKLF